MASNGDGTPTPTNGVLAAPPPNAPAHALICAHQGHEYRMVGIFTGNHPMRVIYHCVYCLHLEYQKVSPDDMKVAFGDDE